VRTVKGSGSACSLASQTHEWILTEVWENMVRLRCEMCGAEGYCNDLEIGLPSGEEE